MEISDLITLYSQSPVVGRLRSLVSDSGVRRAEVPGFAVPSALACSWAALDTPCVTLFIMQDADEAGYLYHDLTQMLGAQRVLFFPSSFKRRVKYGQKDAANEILRTEVLARLGAYEGDMQSPSPEGEGGGEALTIVTYPEAISEKVVSKKQLNDNTIVLRANDTLQLTPFSKRLRELGFTEVDYVYEPGQFAMRGNIIDVFSFSSEYPYRIDLFGDDIDSLRTFEVESQLSRDRVPQIQIVPEMAQRDEAERISLLSFLPQDSIVCLKDLLYIRDAIEQTYKDGFLDKALAEKLETATEVERDEIERLMRASNTLTTPMEFVSLINDFRLFTASSQQGVIESPPIFHKNFDLLFSEMQRYALRGYRMYVLADSAKQHERLKEILESKGAPAFIPVGKTLHAGFIDHEAKLCLFTDHQIFDRFHKYSLKSDTARRGKVALTMKELQEMEVGDYVIHADLGIGKFAGLVRIPQGDSYKEVIRIVYKNNDKVDVSIHSLYKISKYKRADSEQQPRLSTLGTGAWERLKERTKSRIKDIARDLIKLYAARKHKQGFAFSPDNYLQHELEASFLYEDTPDQLKATNDVKADMQSTKPMDRLVCGDVGFGKTEVAMRAAFKAAIDGKQTALLVPTTVLAYQHYQSFSKRMKEMPVKIEYLSRAKSAARTRQILEDLAAGKIDIIIGTQKLLSKTVKFKDLGLLIIDEEQKFGVSTKEKLRTMKVNIDTLTMSATPIPRTLQFSLMGARDMSIIQTPPPNRYPVATEIHTFDSEYIVEAINYEMSRNGQVYFVSNRIGSLEEIQRMITRHIPDCRVAIGHGQMKPEELEKIILGFINYDYDVLVSTTIVENGIDISNANTIIINNAHHFGLSDLHQMRGRVGRSNKKAFCYLLAPPLAALNIDARRRLEALETFSELGSGFNISMQDLDIRGAGNLLGAEQSGFMEDLGYETYQKILTQAVNELKSEEFKELFAEEQKAKRLSSSEEYSEDCAIESDYEMFFPDNFVPTSAERMLLYRELDRLTSDLQVADYRARLIDRFGKLPPQAEALLLVVPLRRLGKHFGCEKLILKNNELRLQFVDNEKSLFYDSKAFSAVINYMAKNPARCHLKPQGKRIFTIDNVPAIADAVSVLRQIKEME